MCMCVCLCVCVRVFDCILWVSLFMHLFFSLQSVCMCVCARVFPRLPAWHRAGASPSGRPLRARPRGRAGQRGGRESHRWGPFPPESGSQSECLSTPPSAYWSLQHARVHMHTHTQICKPTHTQAHKHNHAHTHIHTHTQIQY